MSEDTSVMKASLPLHIVAICAVAFLSHCRSSENNFTRASRIFNDGINGECGTYLAPSLTLALGRALIAGNDIASGQQMTPSIALAVRNDDFESTQLMNYLFGTHEDDISIATIGLDMMLNHRETKSIERTWENSQMRSYFDQKLAHTTYNNVILSTASNVSAGEELFCSYGGTHWFESRDFSPSEDIQDSARYSAEDLKQKGVCMTNVEPRQSKLSFAGKGLFAKKDFRKGDLVVVSPVLLLPKDHIESISDSSTVLMNYCIASHASSTVMFPFAWGAVANHAPPHRANLEVELFWWNKEEEAEKTSATLFELSSRLSAQLDLGYRATRDIARGEEMYFDYGEEWQVEWSDFLADVRDWSDRINDNAEMHDLHRAVGDMSGRQGSHMGHEGEDSMPQFRQFIGGQDHLFLAGWRDVDEAESSHETSVASDGIDGTPFSPSSLSSFVPDPLVLPASLSPQESVHSNSESEEGEDSQAGSGYCTASLSSCDRETGH